MPTSRPPRPHVQCFRLSRGELATLRARAHAAGLTLSELFRRGALGQTIRARPGQLERDAIYQLSKIGTNLNQLARVANTTGQLVALALIEPVVETVQAKIAELGG